MRMKATIYSLKDVIFPEIKGTRRNTAAKVDVAISVANMAYGKDMRKPCISLSFSGDVVKKFTKDRVSAAVVGDRLYIKFMDTGYKLTQPHDNQSRKYVRIPIEALAPYMPFAGDHDLCFDRRNDAYYVVK